MASSCLTVKTQPPMTSSALSLSLSPSCPTQLLSLSGQEAGKEGTCCRLDSYKEVKPGFGLSPELLQVAQGPGWAILAVDCFP